MYKNFLGAVRTYHRLLPIAFEDIFEISETVNFSFLHICCNQNRCERLYRFQIQLS
jgi:hypothetical protein